MSRLNLSAFEKPIYVTRPMMPELKDYNTRLEGIWNRGVFSNNGPEHNILENSLKEYLRVENISLFNNGMSALISAMFAFKISGEVIVTPFTFSGTVHAITLCGATPVFADIDPVSMNIDPTSVNDLVTDKTTAILGVHVYGNACDVYGLQRIADRYGLRLIFDAAHAFGKKIGDKPISSFGDATMFSFHATKLFHTGEGGALVVKSPEIKQAVELFKNFGIQNEDSVTAAGFNGKMSEIQAALGNCNILNLESEKSLRTSIMNIYSEQLSGIDGLTLPPIMHKEIDSLQYYCIRIENRSDNFSRDHLYNQLKKYNIFARKYFYPLCSDYACYQDLNGKRKINVPIAEKVSKEVLCLPFYGSLSQNDALQISEIIKYILTK